MCVMVVVVGRGERGARFVHRCHLDFVVTPGPLRNWQQ